MDTELYRITMKFLAICSSKNWPFNKFYSSSYSGMSFQSNIDFFNTSCSRLLSKVALLIPIMPTLHILFLHPCPTTIIWTYKKYLKALPWSHNTAWFITLGVQTNTNSIQVLSKNLLNTTTKSRLRLSTCTSRTLLWCMSIQIRYCITLFPFEYITNWFALAEFPGLGYHIPLMKAS